VCAGRQDGDPRRWVQSSRPSELPQSGGVQPGRSRTGRGRTGRGRARLSALDGGATGVGDPSANDGPSAPGEHPSQQWGPRTLRAGGGKAPEEVSGVTKRVTLPVHPASCAVARHLVRATLHRIGWGGDVEAAVLLTSELVANAIDHAHSPCRLSMRVAGTRLRIEVADADPGPPVLDPPAPDSSRGRGLILVDTLASAWGSWREADEGKTVWFELSAHAGRRSRPSAGVYLTGGPDHRGGSGGTTHARGA